MEAPVENTSRSSIPIILVSAYDIASANVLISEIINSKVQNGEGNETTNESQSRVWQIENKYYTAEVELYPVTDNDTLPLSLSDRIEAHIIYITDDEEDEMASERAEERWARASGRVRVQARAGAVWGCGEERVGVHLLVSASAAPALDAWARRRRYEHVPLRDQRAPDEHDPEEDDHDDDDVYPDACGIERVRDALHAHTWRGLRRLDAHARAPPSAPPADDGDGEVDGEGEDGEQWEQAIEQAEAFAAAVGALRGARDAGARLPAAQRRRLAERHVLALLHSMGVDMHAL